MNITIDDIEEIACKAMRGIDKSELSGNYYRNRLKKNKLFGGEDKKIIEYIKNNFNKKKDIIFEPGCGIGQLALSLGIFGFEVIGVECDSIRYNNAIRIKKSFDKKFGNIMVSFLRGSYPDIAPDAKLLVVNNFVSSSVKSNEEKIIKSFVKYSNIILCIEKFGFARDNKQQEDLLKKIEALGFKSKNLFNTVYLLEK